MKLIYEYTLPLLLCPLSVLCECQSFLPLQILLGFERLQAIARSHLLTKQFQALRQRMVQLQALCRGYLVRQQVQARRKAVVVIQAYARGMAARRNFRRQKANVGGHCRLGQAGDVWAQMRAGTREE